MEHFYVACDLGEQVGRITMGTLRKGNLTISEVRSFPNSPVKDKESVHWNIPRLYHELLTALREVSVYDEPVDSLSCCSWGADYLLFEPDGALVPPTFHPADPRTAEAMNAVPAKIPWETIYEETGAQPTPRSTLVQLAAEKPRRLKRAACLLPIADGFNYLLSGVPRVEMSLASTTQLFNPVTRTWSDRLLDALGLPPQLFPPVIAAGAKLGGLRPEIFRESRLEENPQVVVSCSHELAAALAGLPVAHGESWAYLRLGSHSLMGTELIGPIINDAGREARFTNEIGFGGSVHFQRQIPGLWILDECKRFWRERDRELEDDVLTHLAIAATPFESLIDPADARFLAPGEMPLKIQAFCKETGQPVPRKPGPILRCVLESLALLHRRTFQEIELQTGRDFTRLYVLDGAAPNMLHHFTANALQVPVVIASADAAAIGNVLVQALALGHVKSLDEARDIVRGSIKLETITPHAAVWNAAFERLTELVPS